MKALQGKLRTLITQLPRRPSQVSTLGQVKALQKFQYFLDQPIVTLLLGAAAHRLMLHRTWATQATREGMDTPKTLPVMTFLANRSST
jgi:hypothetical protein